MTIIDFSCGKRLFLKFGIFAGIVRKIVVPKLPVVSIANGLDWQTAARGNLDPQRFSGALANHHCIEPKRKPTGPRKCRSLAEIAWNHIYVVPQNQAKT